MKKLSVRCAKKKLGEAIAGYMAALGGSKKLISFDQENACDNVEEAIDTLIKAAREEKKEGRK